MHVSYWRAIEWIVVNDDTDFLDDTEVDTISVTASLVADMFQKDDETVKRDIRATRDKYQATGKCRFY